MIIIHNLSMAHGNRVLFGDVNLVLGGNKRYGLVGANGTGKSTFLRLLAKEEAPSDGTVTFPNKMRIGWLKQDQFKYEHDLVLNVVLRGKRELWAAMEEKNQLLKGTIGEKEGYRLSELEDVIAEHDGYSAESVAEQLLIGLGITQEHHYEPLSMLSGGFKLRVLLAQALFDDPDILLLDEPNNYLDVVSIAWLETYLMHTFKGLLLFTSHDHSFLNTIATHILDVDYGEIREYVGNYDAFLKAKTLVVEQKQHQREHMEKKIARIRIFVERFRASPSKSSQALARERQIEKMELPDVERSSRRAPSLRFVQERPSGKEVLRVSKIRKSFGEKMVLKNVSFAVHRGDKIAIIGQNGIGKSTLLKILMGLLPADHGTYEWGHETHISYFAQEHNEMSHDATLAVDWLGNHTTNMLTPQLRQALGGVLFTGDDAYKKVCNLSGGEISRLLCAKIMLEKNNVLIFDEPTNHLDIESREALAKAIKEFVGTVLVVSHDRHFVAQVATRIVALSKDSMIDFQGGYDDYILHGIDHLQKPSDKKK